MTERIPRIARIYAPHASIITRVERMSPAFVKYHLADGRALHRFTRPEPHAYPHDHPWPFQTEILAGGYVEEVFTFRADGGWHSELVTRLPGTVHQIAATHIHRIVHLPTPECWTLVQAGRQERVTQFWRFGDPVQRRAWNARRWSVHKQSVQRLERQLRFENV